MTLAEYFDTPETLLPQELIDGTIRVADAPFVSHQRIVLRLAMALQVHAKAIHAGELFVAPIDVVFDRARPLVVQPDLLFVSRERLDIVQERIYGAPDLVVEILSPRPRIGDIAERIGLYAQYGVREIWLYHQAERRLQVLGCDGASVAWRADFSADAPVVSGVFPDLRQSIVSAVERG